MHRYHCFAWAAGAALFSVSVAGVAGAQTSPSPFALRDGDRVVFYGDSITDQRLYTTFAEDYVVTRFSRLNIKFVHSGWGGDRVTGGGGGPIDLRLRRDVLVYKPTVMTIMLGMNDGGYQAFNQGTFDTFTNGYAHILDTVQKAAPGVRFTLIEPSPSDDVTRAPKFDGGYNGVLARYGAYVTETAGTRKQIVADFNTAMVAMLATANAADPNLAQQLIPDRIHPSAGGHLIMAEALLKAWHAPSLVAAVRIDAASGKTVQADNTQVSNLKTGAVVSWDERDAALPMVVDPGDPLVRLALKSSDFTDALNREPLRVTGLSAAKRYTLRIDNSDVTDLTGAEFARGVNLATLPTPMARQALIVLSLTREHNDQHFARWRTFQVPLDGHSPAVGQALAPLLVALDAEEDQTVARQHAAAQPVMHHYEIAVALPPPTGANLAQGKPYVVSDPNVYNFGIGGLTDGSWDTSPPHTFATGEAAGFPKTATIDLGAPTNVGAVVVGVPPFGSTKTIAVSVSADGQAFKEVGRYVFSVHREEKHVYRFPSISGRYVRLTYVDHYDEQAGFSVNFAFTTEAEVYASANP